MRKLITFGFAEIRNLVENGTFQVRNLKFSLIRSMEKKLVSPNLIAAIHYELQNKESLSDIMETFEIWSRGDPILEARV